MVMSLSPGMEFWRASLKVQLRRALRAGAFALTLSAACLAQGGTNVSEIHQGYHPEKDTNDVTVANQSPDIGRRLAMDSIRAQRQFFAAANAERKRQMSGDTERLVQLAAELNSELEKLGEVDLRLAVKAEAIEKLARAVKDKMKLTMAPP
jgi:flagellar motility protein MotE (MotC chaperone)